MPGTILARLTDRLILRPTRHSIDADGQVRRPVGCGDKTLEVWVRRVGPEANAATDLYVIKFPGAAGRAERSTAHPTTVWPELNVEVWTPNLPGYGGSAGRASLRTVAAAAESIWFALRRQAGERPIIVLGNSLGCVSALYLAARQTPAGLILRNPPPLGEVIRERFGWRGWNPAAALLARQIPAELDAIRNAARATAPAVFVMAARDRIVPPPCQDRIWAAYGGPKQTLRLALADHYTSMTDEETDRYRDCLTWLGRQIGLRAP